MRPFSYSFVKEIFDTKLEGIPGALIILTTDFLFVYAVEFLRAAEKLYIGQEMNLGYHELATDQTVLACFLGIVAIIIGASADNYGWSFQLAGIGVLFSFLASCYILTQANLGFPKSGLFKIGTSVYITTSMIKIVIIIGQILLPAEINQIRPYVFVMVYSRLIANALTTIVNQLNVLKIIHSWFAFLFTLFYVLFFSFYLRVVMHSEIPRLGIMKSALRGYYLNCIRTFRRRKSKKISIQPEPSRKSLLDPVFFWNTGDDPENISQRKLRQYYFELNQCKTLCKIFPILFFGVFFSILDHYVVSVTTFQAKYVKSIHIELLGKVEIVSVFIVYKLVFYILAEYLFQLALKEKFKKDLLQFAFGYFILLLAYLSSIYIHFNSISYLGYTFPKRNEVQLRIFNAMDHSITAYVDSVNIKLDVGPFLLKTLTIAPYQSKYDLLITAGGKNTTVTIENVKDMSSRSMMYYQEKIIVLPTDDPKISEITGDHYFAYCYFQLCEPMQESVEFNTKPDTTTYSFTPKSADLKAFEANTYERRGNLIVLKKGVLYAAVLYKRNGVIHMDMFYLEGPNPISMVHLLPQVILESVASAIATPSFFRFLYTESPTKMRCTTFTTFMSIGFFFLPFVSTEVIDTLTHGNGDEMIFAAYVHFFVLLLIIIADKCFPYEFPGYYPNTL